MCGGSVRGSSLGSVLVGHKPTPQSSSLAHLSSAPSSRTFETFLRLVDLAEVGLRSGAIQL